MTMADAALAGVLAHPAIWRGDDCAPEPAALPSGHAALDAVLPGGGWPAAALTEIALAREGIGELRLVLPALAALQAARRDVVFVAPPHRPYAPALLAAGLDPAALLVVRCHAPQDALWAYEQALRAPECGAAFAWLATRDERVLRRLAVAARDGGTLGVLWRRPGHAAGAPAAALRLALAPHQGRLAVGVVKRRGGDLARPVLVDVGPHLHPLPRAAEGAHPHPNPLPHAGEGARPRLCAVDGPSQPREQASVPSRLHEANSYARSPSPVCGRGPG
jgi:cell division inhibitor SulA